MAEWEKMLKKELLKNGFIFARSGKGSHVIYTNGGVSVTVPKTVSRNMANVILKEAGIDKRYE